MATDTNLTAISWQLLCDHYTLTQHAVHSSRTPRFLLGFWHYIHCLLTELLTKSNSVWDWPYLPSVF